MVESVAASLNTDFQRERIVALEDFYLGYQNKDLQQGEMVYSVVVPRRSGNLIFRAYKIAKRFDQDISSVLAARQFRS